MPRRHQRIKKNVMSTLGERLRIIRDAIGESQKGMASRFGLSENAWQRLELEGRAPKGDILAQLIDLGFSSDWLLTGQGQMRPSLSAADPERPTIPVLDEELNARVVEAVTITYQACGAAISPRDLGRVTAQIYNEIAGADLDNWDAKLGALGLAVSQLRRRLTAPLRPSEAAKHSA